MKKLPINIGFRLSVIGNRLKENWKIPLSGLIFLALVLILPFTVYRIPNTVYAQGGIFEPRTIPQGIFEGIRDVWKGIFGPEVPERGGAQIPVKPGPPPTPLPSPPPAPDSGDFIKLTLEWDALSVGPEVVAAAERDPFEDIHRSKVQCCDIPISGEQCAAVNIRHVLWGWCGQTPTTKGILPPLVPIYSPGPNDYTYSFAVSNKYIRRDGYLFDCVASPCVADCSVTKDQYMEFQTEVFHTNDIALYLKVENLSDHKVENLEIEGYTLMYTPLDKTYSLPHNIEYPLKVLDSNWPPRIQYAHGHQLPEINKTIENTSFVNLPPIKIGPFDLNKGESKTFPLQDDNTLRDRIPSSLEDPYTCEQPPPPLPSPTPGEPSPAPPAPGVPCECQAVRLHSPQANPGQGCSDCLCDPPEACSHLDCSYGGKPTVEQCRWYYGIVPCDDAWGTYCANYSETCAKGKKYCTVSSHKGTGYICNKECITLPGCPPPYCFEGSVCKYGSPNSPECKEWFSQGKIIDETQDLGEFAELKDVISQAWGEMSRLFTPSQALSFGCSSGCVNPPRIGVKGKGGIVPRDFENFINEYDCKMREFKDVTMYGGCGYEASSNNSVIGPLQFTVTYGKTRPSRSVLLASIPIGGKIIDDEARPFGWPMTGEISQNWGNTGQAQEQGPYRSTPGELYTDYLSCPNQGLTYPKDGRPRAGDWLHPGVDIKPVGTEVKPLQVYATHAGWVTFAGPDQKRPEHGWVVQVESDVTQDNKPDFATRYEHLSSGSLQFDVQYKRRPFTASSKLYPLGQGVYVAKNSLIGTMGDSGTPGIHHLHYEILQHNIKSGDPDYNTCIDDPYEQMCVAGGVEGYNFSKLRFEPQKVKGPVYTNP